MVFDQKGEQSMLSSIFPVPLSTIAVFIVAFGVPQTSRAAELKPTADNTPQLFLPGAVSSELPEFAVTFAPDGNEVYFNRTNAERTELKIYRSRKVGGRWSPPNVVSFSGEYRDVDPFITADGRRLYFSSNRPRKGTDGSSFSTWYVERTANGWSEPIDPGPPLNSNATDIYVTATRDGLLVFNSQRDGVNRVYTARETSGVWQDPQPLRFGSVESAGNPRISADGEYMLMVQVQERTGPDLFYSCKYDDGWREPVALPAIINSEFADFAPAIDPAGESLFFTSERPGMLGPQPAGVRPPGDIYKVSLAAVGIHCE
ncbi:MAG: hypothetical protein RIA65_04860 [Woeseia sp.]